MGVTNFRKLIDCLYLDPPMTITLDTEQVALFDSILIDIQSMLYIAIDQSFSVNNEVKLLHDISLFVQKEIARVMLDLFASLPDHHQQSLSDMTITVICSFDGHAVPMKWPVQASRRHVADITGKNLYRVALFNNNVISARVRDDLIQSLTNKSSSFHYKFFGYRTRMPKKIRYIISGCDVTGEGEHKIFEIAESEHVNCKRPIVVSVDNDAFVLSFARLDRYDAIQLYKGKKKQFYHLTDLARHVIQYPIEMLVLTSFLFGNDFMPAIITITTNNHIMIQDTLTRIYEDDLINEDPDEGDDDTDIDEDSRHSSNSYGNSNMSSHKTAPLFSSTNRLDQWIQCLPDLYQQFLERMKPRIAFRSTPYIDPDVIHHFWITVFWISDYYRKRHFPQKTIENKIMGLFDRHMIITALLDKEVSRERFDEAFKMYTDIGDGNVSSSSSSSSTSTTTTGIIPLPNLETDAIRTIFDTETFNAVSRFLIIRDAEKVQTEPCTTFEGFCHDVTISALTRKRKLANVM